MAHDQSIPTPGQIWVVGTPQGQLTLVLLLHIGENIVQVRPISKRIAFACSHDLAFPAETSPIHGVQMMIECWNPRPVLRSTLLRLIAEVDALAVADVRFLSSCVLHGTEPNRLPLSPGFIGTPLFSPDDPRSRFQTAEFDRTDFLSAQVNALN